MPLSYKLKLALVGLDLTYSLSPVIFERLFETFQVDGSFMLLPLMPEELSEICDIASDLKLDAFMVTMPYKRSIIPYLDGITDAALTPYSVNLVVVSNGGHAIRLYGDSTDGEGFRLGLEKSGIDYLGKSICIYGMGGAAVSIAYELRRYADVMLIPSREKAIAASLATRVGARFGNGIQSVSGCDIFINATPLGMSGHSDFESFDFLNLLDANACVCDLIYAPRKTGLLLAAEAAGLKIQNGIPMLENQAQVALKRMLVNLRRRTGNPFVKNVT